MEQRKFKITSEEIQEAYYSNLSLHETAVKFNMTTVTLWRKAKAIGLHWRDKPRTAVRILLSEILEGKHPSFQTFKLKNRLLLEGVKKNECEECGLKGIWNDKLLNMQLDHKDGDSHNHLLNNLRLLCPNCHSQTTTWCGKNIGGVPRERS